jgi:hypothetical protein
MSFHDAVAVTSATIAVMNPENILMLGSELDSDPEMTDLFNPHWRTFPKPPLALNIIFGLLCFVLGIVGMIGNATVIFIFTK